MQDQEEVSIPPIQSKALIRLLDGKLLEVDLHPRLSVDDLLRSISDLYQISSADSRLFALGIFDRYDNFHWLDPLLILRDMALTSHNPHQISLYHHVRFFLDTIYDVQSGSTAKFYFHEVYNQVKRHEIVANSEDYFDLVATVIAVYTSECQEDTIREAIQRVMPHSHPPYILMKNGEDEIERRIYEKYQQYRRLPVGTAMLKFLKTAEKSESYGYRMYHVLNEDDDKCLLSIGSKGVFVYRRSKNQNLITPYLAFPWRVIDNLYYREEKFSVEIRHQKRSEMHKSSENLANDVILANDRQLSEAFNHPTTQVSTGRRRQNRLLIYNFTCASAIACRHIWAAAIGQHQFFLEQKALKKKSHQRNTLVDHQELTEKLNRLNSTVSLGASSLPSLSSLHSTTSSIGTMPSAKIGDGSTSSLPPPVNGKRAHNSTSSFHKKTEEEFQRDSERYDFLTTKKMNLYEKLDAKLNALKETCIAEANITGELPEEIHEAILPGEDLPVIQKKVGTSYQIPDDIIVNDKDDKLGEMETTVEVHRRIVAAASRLATERNTNKSLRKKRQKDLQEAKLKLNRLEQGLQQMRHSASKPDISSINSDVSMNSWAASHKSAPMTFAMTKSCPTTPRGSVPDLSRHRGIRDDDEDEDEQKSEYDDSVEETVSRRAPSAISRHSLQQRYSGVSSSSTSSGSDSLGLGLPPRPNSRRSQQQQTCDMDNQMLDSGIYENIGYRSTSYRSSYRQAHYPTIQDEHHQRKRAQSAHSISTDNGGMAGRTSTYSVPLNDASQKFINDYDEVHHDDDDITPTNDIRHPQVMNVRRMTSSISCQAGFTTASLDRRYAKNNGTRIHMNGPSDDMVRQNITTRITTFPVSPPTSTVILSGKPYSASDLPRFHAPPPISRVSHMPRGSLPPYSTATSGVMNHSIQTISANRVPINTNPQMEALLSFYKQQQQSHHHQQQQQQKPSSRQQQPPKTATIV